MIYTQAAVEHSSKAIKIANAMHHPLRNPCSPFLFIIIRTYPRSSLRFVVGYACACEEGNADRFCERECDGF